MLQRKHLLPLRKTHLCKVSKLSGLFSLRFDFEVSASSGGSGSSSEGSGHHLLTTLALFILASLLGIGFGLTVFLKLVFLKEGSIIQPLPFYGALRPAFCAH